MVPLLRVHHDEVLKIDHCRQLGVLKVTEMFQHVDPPSKGIVCESESDFLLKV